MQIKINEVKTGLVVFWSHTRNEERNQLNLHPEIELVTKLPATKVWDTQQCALMEELLLVSGTVLRFMIMTF